MAFNLFPQTDFRQMDLNYVLEVSKQAAANLEEYAADKEQVVATQAAAEQALAAAQQDIQTATQAAASASQDAQTATGAAGTATQAAASAEQDAQTAGAAAQTAEEVAESIPEDYTQLSEDVAALKSDLGNKVSKSALSFNIWNEKWKVVGTHIESANFIPVIGGLRYLFYGSALAANGLFFFDKDFNQLSGTLYSPTYFTPPSNAKYITFKMGTAYGTTYNNDICINIDQPNLNIVPHNGQYVPYSDGLDTYNKIANLEFDVDELKIYKNTSENDINNLKGRANIVLSKNRYNVNDIGVGFYNASGEYTNNANYCYFKVDVNEGDVLKFYFLNKYNEDLTPTLEVVPRILSARYICGFDGNGNFIASSGAENVVTYTVPEGVKIVIVSNAKGGTNQYGRNYEYYMAITNDDNYPMTFIPFTGDGYVYNKNWFDASCSKNNTLFDKKGVFFGDSITEGVGVSVGYPYTVPSVIKDIGKPFPSIVNAITKLNAINCGFGGTRMSYTGDDIGASFPNVCDAIISGDFSNLQSYVNAQSSGRNKDRKQEHLDALESLDFSTVDFIVISYGTNDWAGGVTLDNPNNPLDKTTILGGLRYGVDKLLTAYPTLKVFILTPIYRYTISSGVYDSDITQINGITLKDLSDAIYECAKYLHAPCKYMYGDCNINKYNYNDLIPGGVHPNDAGYIQIGEIVSGFLSANY